MKINLVLPQTEDVSAHAEAIAKQAPNWPSYYTDWLMFAIRRLLNKADGSLCSPAGAPFQRMKETLTRVQYGQKSFGLERDSDGPKLVEVS